MLEILLEQPGEGVRWSWHTTKKGITGAGVSKTLWPNLGLTSIFLWESINFEMHFKTKIKDTWLYERQLSLFSMATCWVTTAGMDEFYC